MTARTATACCYERSVDALRRTMGRHLPVRYPTELMASYRVIFDGPAAIAPFEEVIS
jgi:hypothetical protein